MKKELRAIAAAAVIFALTLTACQKKDTEFTGISDGLRYSESYQIVFIAPEGVVYKGKDDMVHFRAEGTSEDIILCYDPNCIHEPASLYNPDPTCRAALFNTATTIAYYEGKIYYFVKENVREHKIYKGAVNGSGRSLIAEMPYTCDTLRGMMFYEDKMYYIVAERFEADDKGTLGKNSYIVEYDLKSNEYRLVTPVIRGMVLDMQMTKEYIYVRLADGEDGGRLYVRRYNIETGEEEIFTTTDEYQSYRLVRAYENHCIYAYYSEKGEGVIMKDLGSGSETVLIEADDGHTLSVSASGNGILYKEFSVAEDGGIGLAKVGFYDLLAGETTDITEKAVEMGIRHYDGYNKVFICNNLYDISVISEETILGR